MFFSLAQHNNVFVRPEKSNLVLAVPLCARTVIFFCDDLTFYHYSLIENKILYQSKLPGRIIQAISLSGHQILCTINQSRALMLLNIQERSFEQICKLPQTKIHNQNRQKDIFTQTKLHIFEKTNYFYIEEPRREENKTKIYFYGKSAKQNAKIKVQDFIIKEINTRRHLLTKFDSERRLVLYKQEIDDNGVFKFSTIDCCKDFLQTEYACANEAFTRAAIIRQVRLISPEDDPNSKVMIFVNSSTPQILIFSNNQIHEFGYKPNKMLLSTILINAELGYGMFMFMPDRDQNNPNYENVIELLDMRQAKVLQRRKLTVKQVVKSWQDDYFLLYKQQLHPSNSSSFQTENIISKKAFYMKFLWEKGFSDYSEAFMAEIIGMLQ